MAPESRYQDGKTRETPNKRAWEALTPPLAEWILDAVSSMGFKQTTPVQASTIPLFMTHKDVVVEAVTGSGKTLAFLIPVIEQLLRLGERTMKHHVGAIIISPTRELATQIHNVLLSLLAFHAPSAALLNTSEEVFEGEEEKELPPRSSTIPVVTPQLLVGGSTSSAQDLSHFLTHSPNILIATPGRLLDLISSPRVYCSQSSFEVLILDEADRLLDLGFKDDLQKILCRLPKQRRTGLFSASVSEAVDQIVRVGLRNPVKVAVKVKSASTGAADSRIPASLSMHYVVCPASHHVPAIGKIFSGLKTTPNKTILFLSTCAAVDYIQHVLPCLLPSSFSFVPLHGKQIPATRAKNFNRFSSAITPTILLTTDVAARGLDIPQVDFVLQVDPPSDPKVFLHRCGRAGRAGRRGMSLLFLLPGQEEDYVRFLAVRKTPVSLLSEPAINVTNTEASAATDKIREVVKKDRALHDKSQRGFVSWVRAYSQHQASSIFRIEDIDWADQGNAWGLLKLPKMPELKKWEGDNYLGVQMDWASYAYKDKKREEARLEALRQREETAATRVLNPKSEKGNKATKRAWSDKLDARDEREVRRTKRHKKRDHDKWEKMTPEERQKQLELEEMIEQVKRQKVKEEQYGEFQGFDG